MNEDKNRIVSKLREDMLLLKKYGLPKVELEYVSDAIRIIYKQYGSIYTLILKNKEINKAGLTSKLMYDLLRENIGLISIEEHDTYKYVALYMKINLTVNGKEITRQYSIYKLLEEHTRSKIEELPYVLTNKICKYLDKTDVDKLGILSKKMNVNIFKYKSKNYRYIDDYMWYNGRDEEREIRYQDNFSKIRITHMKDVYLKKQLKNVKDIIL